MTRLTDKSGAFGYSDLDAVVENPDGVLKTSGDTSRHSLYDATYVDNYGSHAMGYGAFPGDNDPMPGWYDERESTGTVTGASSKNRLGRQR